MEAGNKQVWCDGIQGRYCVLCERAHCAWCDFFDWLYNCIFEYIGLLPLPDVPRRNRRRLMFPRLGSPYFAIDARR